MRLELHSLSWPNADDRLAQAQKKVFGHFNLPIYQHKMHVYHGEWMNLVLRQREQADIIGFIDNDCVPLNKDIVFRAAAYAANNETFLGCAQVANHLGTKSHIYAGPFFLFIKRSAWIQLGQPSLMHNARSDVGEELSYVAEEKGLSYRALYPSHFEREPVGGVWRLSNYGFFGIGTVFADSVYHLFQGRFPQHIDLFVRRCDEICEGTFTTSGMHSATAEYEGKICKVD